MKNLFKRSFVVWLGLYPTLIVFSILFGDLLKDLNVYLRLLITTAVVVPIMVGVLIPLMNRLFKMPPHKK